MEKLRAFNQVVPDFGALLKITLLGWGLKWSWVVKKINQKKKLEPVLKKEKPIRGRKIKMQQGLNDRSFVLLLRKLLVALKD